MKHLIILLVLSFTAYSCNKLPDKIQDDDWGEEINNKEELYLILNDFLEESNIRDSESGILIKLFLDNKNDTILEFYHGSVIDCEDYIGFSSFNEKTALVFCSEQLKNRLRDFVEYKVNDKTNCLKLVDSSGLYIANIARFKLNKGKFIQY